VRGGTISTSDREHRTRALVIIDVQNDFTEGGPMGAPGRDAVARAIGAYVASSRSDYQLVVTTQDWHIDPGQHFVKHAVHCRAETEGAALDPELSNGAGRPISDLVDVMLRKGLYDEDFSGYLAIDEEGTALPHLLAARGIDALDVCGFVAEGCVAATVRDALAASMPVRLITDLSAASNPDAALAMEKDVAGAGALVITSSEAWLTELTDDVNP
jgi:nicotinamidase/pyrazinamidase